MSYCRWSSDNHACDLYVYASVHGEYVIHIAGNRIVGDPPPYPSASLNLPHEAWAKMLEQHSHFLKTAKREDIQLPHAGETFREPDLQRLHQRLRYLRELGYRFPDQVLTTIEEEITEEREAHELSLAG
jgi:hypothetical protein